MSTPEISQVLAQMRSMAAQAGGGPANATGASAEVSFQRLLGESIGKVNALQQQANDLKTGFQTGEAGVDLAQVMIASQKAGLAFSAMTEVRNKLVEAYKDVMNMPL